MVREAGLEPTAKVQRHIRLIRGYILRYRQHVIFVMKQQLQLEPAEKYVDIEEIAPCMLRELIKMIYAEAPDRSSGERRQKIYIKYDHRLYPFGGTCKKGTGVTEAAPSREDSRFQAFFKITVLRSPANRFTPLFVDFWRQIV